MPMYLKLYCVAGIKMFPKVNTSRMFILLVIYPSVKVNSRRRPVFTLHLKKATNSLDSQLD